MGLYRGYPVMFDHDAVHPPNRAYAKPVFRRRSTRDVRLGLQDFEEQHTEPTAACPVDPGTLKKLGFLNGLPAGAHMVRVEPCMSGTEFWKSLVPPPRISESNRHMAPDRTQPVYCAVVKLTKGGS